MAIIAAARPGAGVARNIWYLGDAPRARLTAAQLVPALSGLAKRVTGLVGPSYLGRIQAAEWKRLTDLFAEAFKGLWPANLRGVHVDVEALRDLALGGVTIYAVPRKTIAAKLLNAETSAARRTILGRRLETIAHDCDAALDTVTAPDLRETVVFSRKAIAAIHGGHPEAAQALLSAALEGLTWICFGENGRTKDTSRKVTTPADLDEWNLREFMVFAPIWSGAYQTYRPIWGDALIPRTFARNATAHRVTRRQYNRPNTAQVLLLVTAFCVYINEDS